MTQSAMRPRRPTMRRAVVLFPSGLTLGNLFFGIFAIITASRGDFRKAGIWVLLGGICDALDGRVARAANAGTQFGEELDSLVDAVSFGVAPAMIMYFAVLNRDGWDWIFAFLFAACAVMRLARFNIEQAGSAKTYFQGLPSPAAGCTLASYYWFSQSQLYSYGAIGNLPWQELMRFLMVALSILMISNVPYPVMPRTGYRSFRALAATMLIVGSIALLYTNRLEFFFPMCIGYVAWGLLRSIFFRLFERRQPTLPYDLSEGEDDEEEDEFVVAAPARALPARGASRVQGPRTERDPRPRSRADAPERAPRGDRPQRTEEEKAERAARREKRARRDKGDRPERAARPPRDNAPASPTASPESVEIVGDIPGGAELPATGGDFEGNPGGESASPARKRKRRRRRGERRPRDGAPQGSESEGGDESGGGNDASSAPEPSSPSFE